VTPQLGGSPRLLFGGGDAAALLPLVRAPGELFADGVLHGLAVWSAAASPAAGDH
jgi:type III pantothenate kinase